jgi:hypothetical protein
MKHQLPRKLIFAGGTFILAFWLIGVANAQSIPNISDLVSNVAKATIPSRTYSAAVHQIVSHINASTSASTKALITQTNEIEESDYAVNCETSGAMRATKGVSLKSMVQTTNSTSNTTSPTQNQRLMLSINPLNALRHIEKLPSVEITNDVYQNIPCYKVSGTDQGFTFISWVSKADSYVCRQIILHGSETLFDSEFEYKKQKGCFVPSRVIIEKPSNGMRIEQQFSGHTY